MLGDQSYYLPSDMLVKSDRVSMAHSLEFRVPFMDRRIMELSGNIHHSLLTSLGGPDKLVLRDSLQKMHGHRAISYGKKRGFNVPIAKMLIGELSSLCTQMFYHEADRFSPWLNPDAIREIWDDHSKGRQSNHYLLWSLLIFGLWTDESNISY